MLYINKTAHNIYIELEEALDPENNFVGTTWEDFESGAWLPLSDEQVSFRNENPNASVKEVWEMALAAAPEHVRTAEEALRQMLYKIDRYDKSENVNWFTVNGAVGGWFTPEERSNYKSSIDAAKLMEVETLSFYIGDLMMEVSPALAEQMLAMIQLYADKCFIVTKQHKLTVEGYYNSETLSEEEKIALIDSYDFTSGYPEKLNFEL